MPCPENCKLLFGSYAAPSFGYGDVVRDEVRGEVEVWALSDAPIPWPIEKIGSAKSLVVYAGLAEAVRRESNLSVCHWWGVTPQTVTKWRKALGVGPITQGTLRVMQEGATRDPAIVARRTEAMRAKAGDPARRAKIAAAKRGKKRPPGVIEAMRKGRTGKPQSAEARAKMSAAHKARDTRPPKAGRPWTSEDASHRRPRPRP
jgi:hypothetical protein